MNYIGHHEVARRLEPESGAGFMFGAVVADLLRMSGAKRYLQSTNSEVMRGVEVHTLTNKPAFDGQQEVITLEEDIRESMNTIFPNYRVAKQCSRAVKDLLYDGYVMGIPGSVEAFDDTLVSALKGDVPLEGLTDDEDALLAVTSYIHDHGPPDYTDLTSVATRLHRIMIGRRTEFSEAEIPRIADVLVPHQETIFAIGDAAMDQTVAILHSLSG